MPSTSPPQTKIPVSILAGLGAGLICVSIFSLGSQRATLRPQVTQRTILLPMVAPIVSIESTPDPGDLSTNAGVATTPQQLALNEAKVAVSLSQAQLTQAQMNLAEFKADRDKAQILAVQGKIDRQQADLAVASYKLAQLQHNSAEIGLRESNAQLIAAQAQVSKLGRKANTTKPM